MTELAAKSHGAQERTAQLFPSGVRWLLLLGKVMVMMLDADKIQRNEGSWIDIYRHLGGIGRMGPEWSE